MPSLVKIGPVVPEKKIFLNFVNVFSLFRYYLPLEKGGALHLNKLESPSSKDDLSQVWLKLVQWIWRGRFLNFLHIVLLFRYYLPLEKGVGLHLKKLESSSPKDALCQVWLKLAEWFLKRKFFKFVNVFSLFHIISPWTRVWPFIWRNLNSLRDALWHALLKLAQ